MFGVNLALTWAVYPGVDSEEQVTWHANRLIAERADVRGWRTGAIVEVE